MDFSSFFSYPNLIPTEGTEQLVLLADLDEEGWTKLLNYSVRIRFGRGETVMRRGELERALYIVSDGSLAVLIPDSRGSFMQVATVEAGSVFGELAFFDSQPRSADVRALTDGELLRLSDEAFEVLAAREPALSRALLFDLGRILAARLRQANAALAG